MKKLVVLAVLAGALLLVTGAQADRGGVSHKRLAPTAPVVSFSCDGTLCVYAISPGPLEPFTAYDTSIQFVTASGAGCNLGTGGWHTDSTGALVQVLDEDAVKCGGSGPGAVTAWVRHADTAWDAAAVPGTLVGPVLIS